MVNYKEVLTDMFNELEEVILQIENDEIDKQEILNYLTNLCDVVNDFRFELEDSLQDLLDRINSLEQFLDIESEEY